MAMDNHNMKTLSNEDAAGGDLGEMGPFDSIGPAASSSGSSYTTLDQSEGECV